MGMPRRQPRALRSAARVWWLTCPPPISGRNVGGGHQSVGRRAGHAVPSLADETQGIFPVERRSCRSYMLPGNSRSEDDPKERMSLVACRCPCSSTGSS